MARASSMKSTSPRPRPLKRSFADFDEPDPSLQYLGTTKRLRIETEEAVQEAKRSQASFLEDSVDQLRSSPAPNKYCPESVHSSVTQWIESGIGSESYRERHCRSDTLLSHSDGELIPRRLAKSAPDMEPRRDADGFTLPSTPASTRSRLYEDDPWVPSGVSSASTGSSRKKSLVEDPQYRLGNLAVNHIELRSFYEEFPEDIAGLVDHVRRDRDSPGPPLDQFRQDTDLEHLEMGTGEADVEDYFKSKIFAKPKASDSLQRTDRSPMAKHVVPDVGSKLKVSSPVPDMLYGYNLQGVFPSQVAQIFPIVNEMIVNKQNLLYPFFVIEFKADGPSGSGSLWVATNQCLGASASCVNVAERLNRQLRQCQSDEVEPIASAAFSIAMNGTEARLYISWKQNKLDYFMQKVKSFSLQDPEQYVKFRKYVRNIIDWGKNKRLNEIRGSLNTLVDEGRKTASQLAKSRPRPPADESASSSPPKRRV